MGRALGNNMINLTKYNGDKKKALERIRSLISILSKIRNLMRQLGKWWSLERLCSMFFFDSLATL